MLCEATILKITYVAIVTTAVTLKKANGAKRTSLAVGTSHSTSETPASHEVWEGKGRGHVPTRNTS